MTRFKSLLAATALTLAAFPAFAEGIMISDAYARTSGAMAKSGAAFMVIENHAASDDRLISASSDVAQKVELHTHKAGADGVMQMVEERARWELGMVKPDEILVQYAPRR